jgi:hypothetical protein
MAEWTNPGQGQYDHKVKDKENRETCVDCGVWDKDYRDHFMHTYALNGGDYARYSAAYEFGHNYRHEHQTGDWNAAESHLKEQWERRGQGPWDDFKDAIQYAWQKVRK